MSHGPIPDKPESPDDGLKKLGFWKALAQREGGIAAFLARPDVPEAEERGRWPSASRRSISRIVGWISSTLRSFRFTAPTLPRYPAAYWVAARAVSLAVRTPPPLLLHSSPRSSAGAKNISRTLRRGRAPGTQTAAFRLREHQAVQLATELHVKPPKGKKLDAAFLTGAELFGHRLIVED
jgi:hypothetical protein